MKILALSPSPILPWRRGLEHRIYNFLKPLSSRHQITHLSFVPEEDLLPEDRSQLDGVFEEVLMIEPGQTRAPRLHNRVQEWFFPSTVEFGGKRISTSMKRAYASQVSAGGFDLIFVASLYMLDYVLDELEHPVVFDAIDDPSLLLKREINLQKDLIAKLLAYKNWLIVRQVERKFFCRFKEIVLTSEVDAASMKKFCPNSKLTVIPLGVDARVFEKRSNLADKPTILFTGVMGYGPNAQAMIHFCREILPLISKKQPETELLIVGRAPSDEIIQIGKDNDNVTVTGAVKEIAPYFWKSWVYVCPLISGAGVKTKILEAWAAEIPMVATRLSCDGINVSPDEDILVADQPEQFANAVVRLIEDRQLAREMTAAGKQKVLTQYTWESKAEELEIVFERAVREFKQN